MVSWLAVASALTAVAWLQTEAYWSRYASQVFAGVDATDIDAPGSSRTSRRLVASFLLAGVVPLIAAGAVVILWPVSVPTHTRNLTIGFAVLVGVGLAGYIALTLYWWIVRPLATLETRLS